MPPPRLPRLDPIGRATASPAVVLVLHGGRATSQETSERRGLAHLRTLPFAWTLARAGATVFVLRYRYRGWNAPATDAVLEGGGALDEIARRRPGAPVVLVGHSMGGRAALGAAGAGNVVAVCALAPWLDGSDPVDQLAGRAVLILHGDRDRWTDPAASLVYAVRAKRVTDRVARFELPRAGHFMVVGPWSSLVRRFVLAAAGLRPQDPEIADALRRPPPEGLRVAASCAVRRHLGA